MCHDRVLKPGARPGLGAHNRHARAVEMRARQKFIALGCNIDLHVATLFPGMLGGLGHDRDFSALCGDRNSMSRQGLGLGQVWVAIKVFLCRDRVFLGVGHSCRD